MGRKRAETQGKFVTAGCAQQKGRHPGRREAGGSSGSARNRGWRDYRTESIPQPRSLQKSVLTFSLSNVIFRGRDIRQAGTWVWGTPSLQRGLQSITKGDGYKTGETKRCPGRAPSGPYSAWKGNSLVTEEHQGWG